MKDQRLGWLHNFSLVLITVILIAGFILLLYQLATGQGELMYCRGNLPPCCNQRSNQKQPHLILRAGIDHITTQPNPSERLSFMIHISVSPFVQ